MKEAKTTERALLILGQNPSFVSYFKSLKSLIHHHSKNGFSIHGKAIKIISFNDNKTPKLMICKNGCGGINLLYCGFPYKLFRAGFRVEQFGILFVSKTPLPVSRGLFMISELENNIATTLRKHEGKIAASAYNISEIIISILKKIIQPMPLEKAA